MSRPTSDEQDPRRGTPPAQPDQARPEEFDDELWALISLEQVVEPEPGEEEYARRYLVLSRGHADLLPTLRRLLAGLEGIEIIVDRRESKAPPEIAAQRAEPVLVSPPGPPVIPEGEPAELEALEIEPAEAEAGAPLLLQRYIIVSKSHAALAEILRKLQVTYRGIEVYAMVDRREVSDRRRSEARGDRRTWPQIRSTPPRPRLAARPIPPSKPPDQS